MKNILFKSMVILASTAVLATSCIKETFPNGSTATATQVAESPTALQAMLNSIPAQMTSMNTAGYYSNYNGVQYDFGIGAIHLIYDHMTEDMATQGDEPGYDWLAGSWARCQSMGKDYTNCSYFWDCYYMWIKTCNDVISSVLSAGEPTAATAPLVAKAYAYRAAFYLDLARLYLPKENKYVDIPATIKGLTVPIINEETTEKDANNNPRASFADMYAFILSDLENATKYIDTKDNGYLSPSIGMVNALYAKAYLEMGAEGDASAYGKAIEYADKVINSGVYSPLTQDQWESPTTGFNLGSATKAWIWGAAQSAENINNLVAFIPHISAEASWGYVPGYSEIGVNKALYDSIDDADFRKHSWLDPDGLSYYDYKLNDGANFLAGTGNYSAPAHEYVGLKFRPAQGVTDDNTVGNATEIPLMRIEEMYFVKAEAQAQTDLSAAKTTLNEIVNTRYVGDTYSCIATTKEDFYVELLRQKRIEFWGEGVVMFDYKRLNIGFTRGYEGTNHAAVHCFNCEGRSPQWNMVITRAETQSNKGIGDDLNNPDPSKFYGELWTK